jgi:hypothetical protein
MAWPPNWETMGFEVGLSVWAEVVRANARKRGMIRLRFVDIEYFLTLN